MWKAFVRAIPGIGLGLTVINTILLVDDKMERSKKAKEAAGPAKAKEAAKEASQQAHAA